MQVVEVKWVGMRKLAPIDRLRLSKNLFCEKDVQIKQALSLEISL